MDDASDTRAVEAVRATVPQVYLDVLERWLAGASRRALAELADVDLSTVDTLVRVAVDRLAAALRSDKAEQTIIRSRAARAADPGR